MVVIFNAPKSVFASLTFLHGLGMGVVDGCKMRWREREEGDVKRSLHSTSPSGSLVAFSNGLEDQGSLLGHYLFANPC